MGKVVDLEGPGRSRRRRPRRSKTALVLGGGGFTGGVYEIGALRALDLLAVDRTVNQFDVYVGTSAGALIAALAANGVTPEQMMRVVNDQVPQPFRDVSLDMLMRPNYREFISRGVQLPFHVLGVLREVGRALPGLSTVDLAVALADLLPSGLYTGSGIEEYIRTVLSDPDRTDDFRELGSELYLAATDLDTCERIVFGAPGWDDVPISTAVRASAALPMVYRPARVKDRELVDGGIVSTTNLDIAVEAGAKLIIVVNPLVPYVNDFRREIPTLFGTRTRRISEMGFPKIGYQTFKLLAYQRLHEVAARVARALPRGRHRPDRARHRRRADVPDQHPRLPLAAGGRPPRVPVGDRQAGRRLRGAARGRGPARDRDLGHAGAQGGAALRGPEGREVPRVEADPRADHLHAAASVGRRLATRRTASRTGRRTSR